MELELRRKIRELEETNSEKKKLESALRGQVTELEYKVMERDSDILTLESNSDGKLGNLKKQTVKRKKWNPPSMTKPIKKWNVLIMAQMKVSRNSFMTDSEPQLILTVSARVLPSKDVCLSLRLTFEIVSTRTNFRTMPAV